MSVPILQQNPVLAWQLYLFIYLFWQQLSLALTDDMLAERKSTSVKCLVQQSNNLQPISTNSLANMRATWICGPQG